MLTRAMSQVGVIDTDRGQPTPMVKEYLAAAGIDAPARLPYWGGAFLAWCAMRDGLIPPLYPDQPDSWATWGEPLGEPLAGSIVVLAGGLNVRRVGIVVRRHAGKLYIVGGDHGGAVNVQRADESKVIHARRPPNAHLVAGPAPAQAVDVRVTVEHQLDTPPLPIVPSGPFPELPEAPTADDIEALRRSVVTAMASAAEARPEDQATVLRLASIAADATTATTVDGVLQAKDRAMNYLAGAA